MVKVCPMCNTGNMDTRSKCRKCNEPLGDDIKSQKEAIEQKRRVSQYTPLEDAINNIKRLESK
ncbi:MAG: hypothetical protein ACXAC7_10855 [Candidatus Hodarchaeales archaeon]|jgi:hypothetical protein